MGDCPYCKGGGYITVRKSTKRSREVYGDDREIEFAEPCPYCNGGEQKKAEDIRTRANIPVAYYDASIENFKWDIYRDQQGRPIDITRHKNFVMSFINNFEKWQEKGIGFYIYSKTRGTGKTFLASCICNSLIAKYKISTKFVSASELINISKSGNPNEKNPIDVLCECKVLVLDDIGQKTTGEEWMNDLLFKIIDSRYQNRLVTLFTSNLAISELRVDDRVSSRIDKASQPLPLPEYSYRTKTAYDEKKDFYKELGIE